MSQLTKTDYQAKYGENSGAGRFQDNVNGDIGANDMRDFATDTKDSVMFIEDYDLSLSEVDTTSSVVLAMGTKKEAMFYASDAIDGARTWSITSTDDEALSIKAFTFQIAAGAAQTLPTDSKIIGSETTKSEFASGVWTPLQSGQYHASATKGQNVWWWRIEGPVAQ